MSLDSKYGVKLDMLYDRVTLEKIKQLTDDTNKPSTTVDENLIQSFLDRIEDMINAKLGPKYPTYISTSTSTDETLITDLVIEFLLAKLYARRHGRRSQEAYERYDEANELLKEIIAGDTIPEGWVRSKVTKRGKFRFEALDDLWDGSVDDGTAADDQHPTTEILGES